MSKLYDEYDSPSHKHYEKSNGYQIRTIIGSGKLDGDKMTFNKHDANERYRALCIIKDLIGASRDLALKDKSCYSDDEFLYRFLFARKFNVTEAFQLLINYQLYRQKNHDLLQRLCVLDDTIQMALRDGFPGVLKNRDRRGRKVLVFFTSNWDYTQYSLLTVYRAMLLTLEKLLENKQNQANGFVAIVDWTNFTLRQSAHLNPKILKLMIEGLQVCWHLKKQRSRIKFLIELFRFSGFFPGSLQGRSLHRSTLVCWGCTFCNQTIFEFKDTISNKAAWFEFINAPWDGSARYFTTRAGWWGWTIQPSNVVSRSRWIKSNERTTATILHNPNYSVLKVTVDCVKGRQ